jgi:hypothetical protein
MPPVDVGLGVTELVLVGVFVGVLVGVWVGVRVTVLVGVPVGVLVDVDVRVGVPVAVAVCVGVLVSVCVGVLVGETPFVNVTSSMPCAIVVIAVPVLRSIPVTSPVILTRWYPALGCSWMVTCAPTGKNSPL